MGRQIEAIGMRSIIDIGHIKGVMALERRFPSAPRSAAAAFGRPHRQVSLIIGMKNRELHCTDRVSHGSLRLCKSKFSQGWVFTGFLPKLEAMPRTISSNVVDLPQDGRVPGRPQRPCRDKITSRREHICCLRTSPRCGESMIRSSTKLCPKDKREVGDEDRT